MLDDLRRQVNDPNFDPGFDFDDDDDAMLSIDQVRDDHHDRLFLGMTAAERMMLSIFLFMNVAVIMSALLLATGRIVF